MAPLPEDEGGTLAPGPAGKPGGGDAVVGEAGGGEAPVGMTGGAEAPVGETGGGKLDGGETEAADAPRESSGLDVKPGEEIGCAGDVEAVPADGMAVPVGCHLDGGDGDGGAG